MKYNIYAIRDLKTGFLNPTVDLNDASAIRNFKHACLNTESLFYTHPADYALYKIGEYDTDTGSIIQIPHELLVYAQGKAKSKAKGKGQQSE